MFIVRHERTGTLNIIKLINEETLEYVSLIPEGAHLHELVLNKNGCNHSLLDGYKSHEEFLTQRLKNFKGSKLFPFPNRLNHAQYTFEGKNYALEKNFPQENNAIHGLVLKTNFIVKKELANEEEARVELTYRSEGETQGYPFRYELSIIYVLSSSGFSCTTKTINTSDTDIPVGDGWHPYFKTGTQLNNLFFQLPSDEILETDEKLIPTGKIIKSAQFLNATQVDSHRFDTCYKVNEINNIAETKLYDKAKDLSIILWQETGKDKYNYLQIYIPPQRDTIAIEPMTCAPDAFNNLMGLIVLKPGEVKEFTFGVKLK
jgi:aldose 1-epimerase